MVNKQQPPEAIKVVIPPLKLDTTDWKVEGEARIVATEPTLEQLIDAITIEPNES